MDSGPLRPNTISRKRKRGQSTEEEGEEETAPRPKNIGVIETVCGQKVTLKKKRTSTVLPEHHEAFARLLSKKIPWRAPSNPLKKNLKTFIFPTARNPLLVGTFSILHGLPIGRSLGTLRSNAGLG